MVKKKKEKDANASINKRFRSVDTHTHKCTEKKHERTSDEKKKTQNTLKVKLDERHRFVFTSLDFFFFVLLVLLPVVKKKKTNKTNKHHQQQKKDTRKNQGI